MPDHRWFVAWEELHRKVSSPDFSIRIELEHAREQVRLYLEGALSAKDAEGLGRRLRKSLARSRANLVLDLSKMHWDKASLQPLTEKLSEFRSRIRLVVPKMAATHPELLLIARVFQQY
jgi:hypothetical protein